MSYEWMKQAARGTLGRVTTYEAPLQPGLRHAGLAAGDQGGADRLLRAPRAELESAAAFSPRPKSAPAWCRTCARMFTRMGATEQEIRTLRGIVKALVQAPSDPGETCHSYASISIERCAHAGQGGTAHEQTTQNARRTGWTDRGLQNDGQRREGPAWRWCGRRPGRGGRPCRRWPRPRSSATNRC